MTSHFTLMVLTAAALLWLAFVVRRSRIPVRHRWRRRQARTMAEQLRGRDRSQPPQLLYARLRAMDPLAFEELLLEKSREARAQGDPEPSLHRRWRHRWSGRNRGRHLADSGETLRGYYSARSCRCLPDAVPVPRMPQPVHSYGTDRPRSRRAVSHSGAVRITSGRELLALLNGEAIQGLSEVIEPAVSMPGKRRSD
ncbi:Restriction system protein OS=Sphingobium scionense OX=1404341 GN=GGQ90_004301 PE=4 SV=1 [Sphingobium scionense]